MKRPLRPDETRLWARVAKTVALAPGVVAPKMPAATVTEPASALPARKGHAPIPHVATRHLHRHGAPDAIEPRRLRRLTREREELGPRLDLHGMNQDQAHAALLRFLDRATAEGWRSAIVITGKGFSGDGVLRRRLPDWLADPAIRLHVAGVAEAHRRHGGKGAVYLTLKRRQP